MPLQFRENLYTGTRLPRDEEVLKGRAKLLSEEDQLLVEAVLVRGQSAAFTARLMGASPRSIRNRVRRICRHLTSRRFLDAARAMPYLEPDDGELARLWFCEGVSQRQLCRRLDLTVHELRKSLESLRAQIKTIHRLQGSCGTVRPARARQFC